MKKDLSVLVALLAFIIGVVSYYVNPLSKYVNLCEISQRVGDYKSKTVHVKILMMAGGYYDVVSPAFLADSKANCRTKANIIISDELIRNENFSKLREEVVWKRFESQSVETPLIDIGNIVEIELVGKLEDVKESIIANEKPTFTLKATNFKQLSEIHSVTKEEFEENYFTIADF